MLYILWIDANIAENTRAHHTHNFACTQLPTAQLVVRRGQGFAVEMQFNRTIHVTRDQVHLIWAFGECCRTCTLSVPIRHHHIMLCNRLERYTRSTASSLGLDTIYRWWMECEQCAGVCCVCTSAHLHVDNGRTTAPARDGGCAQCVCRQVAVHGAHNSNAARPAKQHRDTTEQRVHSVQSVVCRCVHTKCRDTLQTTRYTCPPPII